MFSFPSLEYNLTHPHPKGRWFLLATIILFLFVFPTLVLVNLATSGSELVPTLQTRFQPNDKLMEGWWGNGRLPSWLRPATPLCQPKDLGRGDTFRLTNALFDYTVISTWNLTEGDRGFEPREQKRVEYRGESFADCYVNTTRLDWSWAQKTETVTVGIICPGTDPKYPIYISMESVVTFSPMLDKDFIGQYYGPGIDLLNMNQTGPMDYRRQAYAVLELISTDSLTILRGSHLSNTAVSISVDQYIDPDTRKPTPVMQDFSYANGTAVEFPAEANIYVTSMYNLAAVIVDAVNLDLQSTRTYQNMFTNFPVNRTIYNNTAPEGISPADWAAGTQSFFYGTLPPRYESWALALRNGYPVQLGNPTGLRNESAIITNYLCPTYRTKPIRSLLAAVFVGTATMTLSVWGTWRLITAYLAKKIRSPDIPCRCIDCESLRRRSAGTDDSDDTKSTVQAPAAEVAVLHHSQHHPAGP